MSTARTHDPLPPGVRSPWFENRWLISLILVVVVCIPYLQVVRQDFCNYDDDVFVFKNALVLRGLTWDGLKFAFGIQGLSQYHPLTWLSHQLDCQLFGLHAGYHKAHNLLLHLANVLLLFHLLRRMTGKMWLAVIAALIWGLHPMRVEAVAWVAERKELLCSFFGLLTLHAYVSYARRPGFWRYALIFLLFTLTLMSKPMLVTLPCVMLLFDFWPLGRADLTFSRENLRRWRWLALEKLPLVPVVIVFSYLTMLCQWKANTVHSLSSTPLAVRFSNIMVAYVWYVEKTLVPTDLTVLYPLRWDWPVWRISLSVGILVIVTGLALKYVRRLPYLAVGWFFFLGTLVPAIGLVQVGAQSFADRYSYIPSIGLIVLIVWGVQDILLRQVLSVNVKAAVFIAGILVMSVVTWIQVSFWKDAVSLWTRCADVFPDNSVAQNNLGSIYLERGLLASSVEHLLIAAKLNGDSPQVWNNLGNALIQIGRYDDAIDALRIGYRLDSHGAALLVNLGHAFAKKGQFDTAEQFMRQAVDADPLYPSARYYLGTLLEYEGKLDAAQEQINEAVNLRPDTASLRVVRADLLVQRGRNDEAVAALKEALQIQPGYKLAVDRLAKAERGELKPTTQPANPLEFPPLHPTTAPATRPASRPATVPNGG